MKKRILFVLDELNIGGVEKSFISLINNIPADKYDIDLGLIFNEGELKKYIPKHVNVFEIKSLQNFASATRNKKKYILGLIRQFQFLRLCKLTYLTIIAKITKSNIPVYRYFLDNNKDNLSAYDVALSFQGPQEFSDYYVSQLVNAKKKIGWIHFDIKAFNISKKSILRNYSRFDHIVLVSNQAKANFDETYPVFANKTEVILNIINASEILRAAEDHCELQEITDVKRIVTVGRVSEEKGQRQAIKAASILKDKGFKFKWFFVGDGPDMQVCVNLVKTLVLNDYIKFVGASTNPYTYMKNCDVYVQPSLHEGYGITVGEAKLFGMPIVASNFSGAKEQLGNIQNAIIVEESNPHLIADAIIKAFDLERITPEYKGNLPQIERLEEIFG